VRVAVKVICCVNDHKISRRPVGVFWGLHRTVLNTGHVGTDGMILAFQDMGVSLHEGADGFSFPK